MADTPITGKSVKFYAVAGGAPGSPSLVASYTLVGLVSNFTLSGEAEEIPVIHKDNGAWRTSLVGSQGYTLEIEGVYAIDANTGQDILEDAFEATTDSGKLVGWIESSNTSGDYNKYGAGRVLNWTQNDPVDGVATFTCTIVGDGSYIRAVVA